MYHYPFLHFFVVFLLQNFLVGFVFGHLFLLNIFFLGLLFIYLFNTMMMVLIIKHTRFRALRKESNYMGLTPISSELLSKGRLCHRRKDPGKNSRGQVGSTLRGLRSFRCEYHPSQVHLLRTFRLN